MTQSDHIMRLQTTLGSSINDVTVLGRDVKDFVTIVLIGLNDKKRGEESQKLSKIA